MIVAQRVAGTRAFSRCRTTLRPHYAEAPTPRRDEPFRVPSDHFDGVLTQGEVSLRRVLQPVRVPVVGELRPRDLGPVEEERNVGLGQVRLRVRDLRPDEGGTVGGGRTLGGAQLRYRGGGVWAPVGLCGGP